MVQQAGMGRAGWAGGEGQGMAGRGWVGEGEVRCRHLAGETPPLPPSGEQPGGPGRAMSRY